MSDNFGNVRFAVNVVGVDQCVASMNALPLELAKTAFVNACKKAGEAVLKAARDLCPVRFGFLRDALATRAKRLSDGKTFVCLIGVLRGQPRIPIDVRSKGPKRGQTIYAIPSKELRFVELGTSTRESIPFLRSAAALEAVNAIDIFQTEIEQEIDKAVLKVAYGPQKP